MKRSITRQAIESNDKRQRRGIYSLRNRGQGITSDRLIEAGLIGLISSATENLSPEQYEAYRKRAFAAIFKAIHSDKAEAIAQERQRCAGIVRAFDFQAGHQYDQTDVDEQKEQCAKEIESGDR